MNGARTAVAPLIAESVVTVVTPTRSSAWRRVTLAAAACITLLDAILLQRKYGLFTGGFLVTGFGHALDGVAFLGLSALLNVTVAAPLTLAALVALRPLRLQRPATQVAAACAAVLPLAVSDFIIYNVWQYLGDAFDFGMMSNLTGRRPSEVLAVAAPLMSRPLFVLGLSVAAIAGLTWLVHRLSHGPAQPVVLPSPRTVLQRCLTLVLLSSVCVIAVSMTSEAMGIGIRRTPSGQLFIAALNRLSDIDRDGYGVLQSPRDLAPFDSTIQPYAIDRPGNDIDENGIGGDLPAAWHSSAIAPPISYTAWPRRPPVILFVLESLRADAVGAVYEDHRVTPVMDSLAAEGVRVEEAWSHNGVTSQSRYHILTGSLVYGRGDSTLLDDFKNHGYDVAYFSGQNDDFGSLGIDYGRVDKYYDARQDMQFRYSTSRSPGSLAVPHAVVERRIREYLAARDRQEPLFLYVNFHDTHYPYTHAGLENLLGVELLPPSLISPRRRPELRRTYLNATANVDRAIGRVIDGVQAHTGQRPAVVILGDHGESLFEQGFLGHGYALNDAQTRVPFIVSGLPLTITTPFGQSDLRRLMNAAMSERAHVGERPAVRHSREARVFQYLGTLDTPAQIGWMTASGPVTYDFRSERVSIWDGVLRPRDLTGEPKRMFQELVYTFESILLARTGRPAAPVSP
jgi:hypothetical protein